MYTNKEVLKTKLLYAITHCAAIDLDFVAENDSRRDSDSEISAGGEEE